MGSLHCLAKYRCKKKLTIIASKHVGELKTPQTTITVNDLYYATGPISTAITHNEHIYSPKQAARQTEDRVYTQGKEVHNNKITKMHTNIKHSPERLSRHCEWHHICDKC